jgi:2,4-dienoyl-CoA reductase-like NADH-dependent reductase (Old Yellow Enzyme family)
MLLSQKSDALSLRKIIKMATLFEKTTIKGVELKNRLVRSATHEGMADKNGCPTQALFKLYERLAKGGVGLIITGYASVSEDGKSPFIGMLRIDNNDPIPVYRELVKHAHHHGAKIAMQIAHCGRQTTIKATGSQPIAPSVVKEKSLFVKPREMTEDDIERVIDAYALAAERVRESGFDAVQLHGAHGYLINQFLCPYTNRRKDRWGGAIANRMRFLSEIYKRCRQKVGEDYPILIKINSHDNMKKGLRLNESAIMAGMMSQMGFDGIEVSCGIAEDGFIQMRGDIPVDTFIREWEMYRKKNPIYKFLMRRFWREILKPPPFTQAYNREGAKVIKSSVDVPIFLVGGVTSPTTMEEIVSSGDADYISLSRALIADPKFPQKIQGNRNAPLRCIHCNLCIGYIMTRPLRCYHGKEILSQV